MIVIPAKAGISGKVSAACELGSRIKSGMTSLGSSKGNVVVEITVECRLRLRLWA